MWLPRTSLLRPGPCGAFPALRSARTVFVGDASTRGAATASAAPAGDPQPLAAPTSAELLRDSRLAALSGLCYMPPEELEGRLAHHGLQLQARGTTHFTRWFVARQAAEGHGPHWLGSAENQPHQYIFLRGVSWRSADLDALRVWQSLLRALPTPFLSHLTSPPDLLVAHSGVAEMAVELFAALRPHLEGPHLHLAGHSLGGSLATLVGLMAHLKGLGSSSSSADSGGGSSSSSSGGGGGSSGGAQQQLQQQQGARLRVQCTTFGSPPVLALAAQQDEDGRAILQALRLPLGTVRNYVLQDDPVPRALLSADPAFLALKQAPALAGLLRLREQWLGNGVLTPARFLYHPAGDVYLVRWSAEGGHSVRPLAPHTLQEELKLDVATLRSSPMALMQAVLDHHHSSYSTELRAAAVALARREEGTAAASAMAAVANSSAASSPAAAELPGSTTS